MDTLADILLRRSERLTTAKLVNDSLMREIAEIVQPRKADSILGDHNNSTTEEVDALFDTTAMHANQTLAAGMHSNISPMGTTFAKFKPANPDENDHDIANWFHKATQIFHAEIAKSNFHSAADEFYLDEGGFGTAAMMCSLGRKGSLVFETLEMGSYAIAEGENRRVDTLFRNYELTPRQIMQKFQGEDIPKTVIEKAEKDETKDIPLKVLHAIYPREEYDGVKIDDKNMPVASVYILCETKEVLKESGFYESPFAVSRWRIWGKSPWGWSPSYYALPLANQLNFIEQCIDVGVERAAFPAWMIPSTIKGEFDPRPHGQNIYDASTGGDQSMPQELQSNGRVDMAFERAEQKRQMIREAFFEDLFKLLSRVDKQMTAREVSELTAEKTTLFHPFFARITTEFLNPILLRAFAELLRAGKLGNPPEGLFTKTDEGYFMDDPQVEFTSRLANALELTEVSALLQTIDDLQPVAGVVGPSVYDFMNFDKAGTKIARTRGVSHEVLRSSDEIAEIQQQRAEAEQAAAAAEQAQQAASAVNSLGGVEQAGELLG